MSLRHFVFLSGLGAALYMAEAPPASAQANSSTWTPSRTADGHPDFQGVWVNNVATPLQRPKELAGRATLTDEELAAFKKKASELFDNGNSDAAFGDTFFESVLANVKGTKSGFKTVDGETGDYSSVWLEARYWDNRTSLITDPSDGRLPSMTPEAQQRQAAAMAARNRLPAGPEDRSLSERCITYGSPRVGGLAAGYNSYYRIVQTPSAVAIQMEMIHDVRVVPVDGGPHLPSTVQTWLGDSRGHWDGDAFVVDTTNYKAGAFMNASDRLHVIERFTRTTPDTLQYQVTIDDPATWTKPWTVMIPLRRTDDAIYEYACHEGNHALVGILAGARAEEAKKAATAGTR